ncbi:MAG TPA: hypothetical protein VHT03_03410 [Rhizomicrobium sp.]|jgi:hypothetical protein|nr:hypothetical protein [Rhizomicrobium sp.]
MNNPTMKRVCFTISPAYSHTTPRARTATMLRDVRFATNRRYSHPLLPRLFERLAA